MKKEDRTSIINLLIILIVLFTIILILYYNVPEINNNVNQNLTSCTNYTLNNCPNNCVVCPPCEVCSSLSCNSKEFCESIGFNSTWYKSMQKP